MNATNNPFSFPRAALSSPALSALALALLLAGTEAAQTESQSPYAWQDKFKARIDQDVARLKRESLTESLAKLSDVNLYNLANLSGPMLPSMIVHDHFLPEGEEVGKLALDAIMSNRRFRKVFEDLGQMDKAAAAELVNRELSAALTEYLPLYEATYDWLMRRSDPNYKPGKTLIMPSIGISNVPEGEATIAGARLKVLALVWAAGMLELSRTQEQVERVARLGVKQRTELYENSVLSQSFQYQMVLWHSIYHREILSSSLLALQTDRDLPARILQAAGAAWHARQLTPYAAPLTEFDRLAEGRKLDYSGGSLTVKFVGPLKDASFDVVFKELHLP